MLLAALPLVHCQEGADAPSPADMAQDSDLCLSRAQMP